MLLIPRQPDRQSFDVTRTVSFFTQQCVVNFGDKSPPARGTAYRYTLLQYTSHTGAYDGTILMTLYVRSSRPRLATLFAHWRERRMRPFAT